MKNFLLLLFTMICSLQVISQTGNIGIGEASPNSKLEIKGDLSEDLFNVKDSGDDSKLFINDLGHVGIGTAVPSTLFHINAENSNSLGILIEGVRNLGSGTVPNLGAGTRLMWMPAKTAFRAGHVQGTQWDDANVGTQSFAMGFNPIASGNLSFAFGNTTTASGSQSFALGNNTTASGLTATAIGDGTVASNAVSTAIGQGVTASGSRSIAMGRGIEASGLSSFAIGLDNVTDNVSQDNTMAIMGGDVGIGTVSPSFLLEVDGTGSFSGQLSIPLTPVNDEHAASKRYVDDEVAAISETDPTWNGNTNTADDIDRSGSVAIGTSDFFQSYIDLNVGSNMAVGYRIYGNDGGSGTNGTFIEFSGTNDDIMYIRVNGDEFWSFDQDNGAANFNAFGQDIDLQVEGNTDQELLYTNAGDDRVGIGASTTDIGKLNIINDAAWTLGGNDQGIDNLYLENHRGGGDGNIGGSISFSGPANGGGNDQRRHAAITGIQTDGETDHIGLAFYTHNSSISTGDMQESMRLTHDGKLGIGTAAPSMKLSVEESAGGGMINLSNPENGDVMVIGSGDQGGGESISWFAPAIGGSWDFTREFGFNPELASDSGAWYFEDNVILASEGGNVGIGVTNPNSQLEVNGDLQLQSGTSISEFSIDGNLAGNSNNVVPTEQAVRTYVDNNDDNTTYTAGNDLDLTGTTFSLEDDIDVANIRSSTGTDVTFFHDIDNNAGDWTIRSQEDLNLDFNNDDDNYDLHIRNVGGSTPDFLLSVNGLTGAFDFYDNELTSLSYLNFSGIGGSGGYGFRENSGTMQYKNDGGTWTNLAGGDAGKNFLQPFGAAFPNGWTRSNSAHVFTTTGCTGSDSYSLQIEGVAGANATTRELDLSNAASVQISYRYRQGDNTDCTNNPESVDNIDVDYWNGSSWVNLANYDGSTAPNSFTNETFTLTTGLSSTFKIRFNMIFGSGDNFDNYNFDDVTITTFEEF